MKLRSFESMQCSIAGALDVVGDKWILLLMRDMMLGLRRYDEFQQSLGIPPTTLANRLQRMVENGLVTKVQYSRRPVRHSYHLTPFGVDFAPGMIALAHWGDKYRLGGTDRPPIAFTDNDGSDLHVVVTNHANVEQVPSDEVRWEPGPDADDCQRWRIRTGRENRTEAGLPDAPAPV